MALTAKQKLFVAEYLIDLNATRAAIRAGYSNKNADKIGPELLGKTRITEAIQQSMNERAKRTNITADKVLNEIADIAFDDISNYLDFYTDTEGNVRTTIKDSKTINTKNIAEVITICNLSLMLSLMACKCPLLLTNYHKHKSLQSQ